MSAPSSPMPELDALLDAVFWGPASAETTQQLETLLSADEAARDYYRRSVLLHVMLDALSTRPPSVPISPQEQIEVALIPGSLGLTPRNQHAPLGRIRPVGATLLFGVAVSLVVVGYFVSLAGLVMWDRFRAGDHGDVVLGKDAEPAATLTRADDGNWKSAPGDAAGDGGRVRSLQVRKGQAELQFADGAQVTVEGPAEFEVRSSSSGFLRRGRLTAKVPKRAVGFVIDTPTTRIVDLGTEFEVKVGKDGDSEVRVHQGVVETSRMLPGNSTARFVQPTRLAAGEGLRVSAVGAMPVPLARDSTGAFKRRAPRPIAASEEPGDPISAAKLGQISGLKLWLRADQGVVADDEGHVERWEDQSVNSFSAIQTEIERRPQLVSADSGTGFEAIRFDGIDDYLDCNKSLELDARDDLSLFVVFKMQSYTPLGGIFCLRDRVYGDWNSFGGLAFSQGDTPSTGMRVVQAEVSLGGSAATKGHDPVSFDIPPGHAPGEIPLVTLLEKRAGLATLWINGLRVATDRYAIDPLEATGMKAAGSGYVLGVRAAAKDNSLHTGLGVFANIEISEVILCDRALGTKDVTSINNYLLKRHLTKKREP